VSLFQPIELRGLRLENRISVSPMCMYSATDGMPSPFHARHFGALAESGAGLAVIEATAVEAIGRISLGCLGLWDESHENAFKQVLDGLRTYSSTPMAIQLGHAGRKASREPSQRHERQARIEDSGWQTIGPVAEAYAPGWTVPIALDRASMDRVRDAFVAAAQRAVRCGFGLIEIHSAHGYLLQTFLSGLTNHRDDEYGGNFTKRMRFPLEVIAAVRSAVPGDYPIGVRFNGEEWAEGGMTLDDSVQLAGELKALGIDYVTPSSGGIIPGIKAPPHQPGYMLHFSEQIRRKTGIATCAVGGIIWPKQAEKIIADGVADMVAIGRAMLDAPRWGFHAAAELGVEVDVPETYLRGSHKRWPLYDQMHAATPQQK
jgi:2,4-dienoyl-CoA reductase-like NADH-dependent reductase (Old Yellow Enzyme family)